MECNWAGCEYLTRPSPFSVMIFEVHPTTLEPSGEVVVGVSRSTGARSIPDSCSVGAFLGHVLGQGYIDHTVGSKTECGLLKIFSRVTTLQCLLLMITQVAEVTRRLASSHCNAD